MVMGILPRLRMSGWEASRIVGINRQLAGMCRQQGIAFRDVWEDFAGREEMFVGDGLHPSQKGGDRLGEVYGQWVQQQGN
jgi:lysophospholipase L1-like esterase